MKVLITGATGFVGTNLAHYLTTNEHQIEFMRIKARAGMLMDFSANAYIHLAGKAHDVKNRSLAEEYFTINYQLTKELYDHFLNDEAADCFLFISSIKAAADTGDQQPIDEERTLAVESVYGQSKKKAESYILSNPPADGKRVYILRPCMIHGPGNKGNLNLLYKLIDKGLPYPLAAFDNKRSFLSIDNLCFVIRHFLLTPAVPSGIYHVADAYPLSTNQVIRIMAEETGRRPRLWHINTSLIRFLARVGDVIRLPLNSQRLQKLTENYIVDTQKLVNVLNSQLPIDPVAGLRLTIRHFSKTT